MDDAAPFGEAREGEIVAGRFRLARFLGEGGMGEVWAATELATGAPRAVKLLKRARSASESGRRRFLREARAAMALRHPGIVTIHEVIADDDIGWVLVMDLLEGETLRARLDREGKLGLSQTVAIVAPVISAVATAHAAGIVHRDLKPENVFLGIAQDVRVLDFGVAKLPPSGDTPPLTESGDRIGTPQYMAPEQARGELALDHRADVWALGVIIYEMLSGQSPIRGDNVAEVYRAIMFGEIAPLREVVPDVPAPLGAVVARMLARDPTGRPKDLREVAAVLAPYGGATVDEVPAARSSMPQRDSTTVADTGDVAPPPRRRRWLVGVLALVVAALIFGGVTFAVVRRGASSSPPKAATSAPP